jgi:pilus assembly protein CpaF
MQDSYRFIKEYTDEHGTHGSFRATGVRPNFLQELQSLGIEIPGSHFETSQPL